MNERRVRAVDERTVGDLEWFKPTLSLKSTWEEAIMDMEQRNRKAFSG